MSERLDRDLGAPGLARLLSAARERFELLGGPRGSIALSALSADEAETIDSWWRRANRTRPRRGEPFRCSLAQLDASFREMVDLSLEEILTRTGGRLTLRPVERAARRASIDRFWEEIDAHPLCRRDEAVRDWAGRQRAAGRIAPGTDAAAALRASLDIGAELPRRPPVERSTFASERLGDPHGLDETTQIGRFLTSQLAGHDGLPAGAALSAGDRRSLLERYGVLCDPASAVVLTLGLAPLGDTALEAALRLLAGRHVVLTLGQLSATPLRVTPGLHVRLCENPVVVLRAESLLGARSLPLVCTGGWPGSAVTGLLETLGAQGATFSHHGDFDWDGLAISRWLRERYAVSTWRYDVDAYRRSLAATAAPGATLLAPRRRFDDDDPLADALRATGRSVPEEAVLDGLIADLAAVGA